MSSIADAVDLLLELRSSGRTIDELPERLRPSTLSDGYDIQDELHRAGGWTVGAIKVGATSEAAQQAMGLHEPFAAAVPAPLTFTSGATIARSTLHHVPFLECEFAMRLGRDVDSSVDIVHAVPLLVDALAPAVELACSRFDPILGASVPSLIADNGVNGALVLGEPVDPVADLTDYAVTLRGPNGVLATGSGAAVLGDPYRSLRWVLEHELARGRSIGAGTWVITGSCTGLTPCPIGKTVTADFGPLGAVSLTLSD